MWLDVAIGAVVGIGGLTVLTWLAESRYWYPLPTLLEGYQKTALGLGAVLALRRIWPLGCGLVALVLYPLAQDSVVEVGLIHALPILLGSFVLVRSGRLPWPGVMAWSVAATTVLFFGSLWMAAGMISGWAGFGWLVPPVGWETLRHYDLSELTQLLAVTVFAVALGQVMRRLAVTQAELQDRNAELLALQGIEAERAVTAERNRISRDLHDIVAHHVTAIVVRAQAALHVSRSRPEIAPEALEWIVDEGKQSLAAMREMVAVLRTDAEGGDLGATLRKVADRLRGGGLDVTLSIPAELPRLPPAVQEAALRIAQEALTNVALHSGASAAGLEVIVGQGALMLTVIDPGPSREAGEDDDREGNGLRHMQERAEGVGGRLTAGPAGNGWRVAAQLPTGRSDVAQAPTGQAPTGQAPPGQAKMGR